MNKEDRTKEPFENWFLQKYVNFIEGYGKDDIFLRNADKYICLQTQATYEGWQAATKYKQPIIGDEALVEHLIESVRQNYAYMHVNSRETLGSGIEISSIVNFILAAIEAMQEGE